MFESESREAIPRTVTHINICIQFIIITKFELLIFGHLLIIKNSKPTSYLVFLKIEPARIPTHN